jgi:adenine phosphoribosyltransferase
MIEARRTPDAGGSAPQLERQLELRAAGRVAVLARAEVDAVAGPGREHEAVRGTPVRGRNRGWQANSIRLVLDLRDYIRDVPDFPQPGIGFKDITPLLLDSIAFDHTVRLLARYAEPLGIDLIVAAEARGFIFGGALAHELGVGFVPARKAGKLPHETVSVQYGLEYGLDELHMHADALSGGTRVLIHDDVLATGGTALAKAKLVEQLGGQVAGCAFLVELAFLEGRAKLARYDVCALVRYDEP